MNDDLLKRIQKAEKELGFLAGHEHANVSEFMRDPTTTSGDLIVLWGTDTTNYAASSKGVTATASSTYAGYVAGRAIDSDDATEWASLELVNGWIYVDLQTAVTIGRYRIYQGNCTSCKISYSNDHLTWVDVATIAIISDDQSGTFTPATARYWRIDNLAGTGAGNWGIYSFELYGPPGTHTLVPLHAVANIGYVLGIGADGFPAYLPPATPAAHKTAHENGGADEISVLGLSGLLADAQTPTAHASTHVTGGSDVIASAVAGGNAGLMTGVDKTKLDGIAAGAEVNVNADWTAVSGDAQILNKPATFPPVSHTHSAVDVAVTDTANYFTGLEVETILAEVGKYWAKMERANTFTLPQTIAGSTDAVQSAIKGVSGQTKDLAQWQTSTGGVVAAIAADGYASFGTGISASSGAVINYTGKNINLETALNVRSRIPAANTLTPYTIYSLYSLGVFDRDISGYAAAITGIRGMYCAINTAANSVGNVGNITGALYNLYSSGGSGGATSAYGLNMLINAEAGWTGTIGSAYNAYIQSATKGGGTITNLYGIYIADQTVGATLNYALVTNAGNVVFNEGGDASTDLRAESDTEANMLFLDSSANALYLGGTTNGVKINKGGVMKFIGTALKSGATQAAAGAAAGEVWKTASHATLPDNVLMVGV